MSAAMPLHHTRPFKSSFHCKLSPDGQLVAAPTSSSILVRSTKTLQTVHVVKLIPELTGPIIFLVWSPSSSKILIYAADQIQVFSACDSSFHAVIRNPSAPTGVKPSLIRFGATDMEVLTCTSPGLKFSVFNLASSTAVEIGSPKFFQPSSVSRSLSIRPESGHLALLTRASGKDMVSIHQPLTRQIIKSWQLESVDAQGLQWTPDGQWIVLWDSPAQGRKFFIYSADGQHYRTLDASRLVSDSSQETESDLELGIKACQLSDNSELCAIGDCGRGVIVLQTGIWRAMMRLCHPSIITPSETLQVWQEDIREKVNGDATRTFRRAEKVISPPAVVESTTAANDARSGCSLISFDASSTLLATRLDDSPCTIWIWDLAAGELRAALVFHSAVNFLWHPFSREVLLVTCQEDGKLLASYVWDPLSQGPTSLAVDQYLPTCEVPSKVQVSWLSHDSEFPEIMVSNGRHYVLLSLADKKHEASPWEAAAGDTGWDDPSTARDGAESIASARPIVIVEDASKLDDTFSFKYT